MTWLCPICGAELEQVKSGWGKCLIHGHLHFINDSCKLRG